MVYGSYAFSMVESIIWNKYITSQRSPEKQSAHFSLYRLKTYLFTVV